MPSSGSGVASTRRAPTRARCGSARRRSYCGRRTTTAATRRGSAGPTPARTTSCRARRWSDPATPRGGEAAGHARDPIKMRAGMPAELQPADGPLARTGLRVQHRRAHVLLGLGCLRGQPAAAHRGPGLDRELVLAVVHAVGAHGGGVAPGLALSDGLELRRNRHGRVLALAGAGLPALHVLQMLLGE